MVMRFLCLIVFLLVTASPALAQEPAPDTATADAASAFASSTRIEVDEQEGVIRFFVEGEEAMRLDSEGLHVKNDINYGGTLTDTGTASYDVTDPSSTKDGEDHDAP